MFVKLLIKLHRNVQRLNFITWSLRDERKWKRWTKTDRHRDKGIFISILHCFFCIYCTCTVWELFVGSTTFLVSFCPVSFVQWTFIWWAFVLWAFVRKVPTGSPSRGGDVAVFVFDISYQDFPLLFCSCIYFCLYGPFNCISFHKFSRQLPVFSLYSSGLISAFICLFMKVSFSPDVIPRGWQSSNHQSTN